MSSDGGMKPGTGGDPFADFDESEDESSSPTEAEDSNSTSEDGEASEHTESSETPSQSDLPYIYSRDNVQSARDPKVVPIQDKTKELEKTVCAEVQEQIGEHVKIFDFREAAYLAALESESDEIVSQLEEWGYNL